MVRPIYSTLLFAGTVPAGTNHPLYTVPDGYRCVVRDIQASTSDSIALAPENLTITQYTTGGIIVRWSSPYLDFGRTYSWSGRVVCGAEEEILSTVINASWNMVMSGYLLTEP
jgi:hypothetical protein